MLSKTYSSDFKMPTPKAIEQAQAAARKMKSDLDKLTTILIDAFIETNPNVNTTIQDKSVQYGELIRLMDIKEYKQNPLLIAALETQTLRSGIQHSLDSFVNNDPPSTLENLINHWESNMRKPFQNINLYSNISENTHRQVKKIINSISDTLRTLKNFILQRKQEEPTQTEATKSSLVASIKKELIKIKATDQANRTAEEKAQKAAEEAQSRGGGPRPGGGGYDSSDDGFFQ
ncbi:MAG: hypothetical protein K0U37_06420 [Gammaproteobacteria bacterium]|nr:hypothetical protein [Gammaproteobacteria bacterium]